MIDYSLSNKVLDLTFARLDRAGSSIGFPQAGTLAAHISQLIDDGSSTLSHENAKLFASASVELWQRAIHSFLWSVALRNYSGIWSSVTGYYASHFVMRAFAHAFGFFKSFTGRRVAQIVVERGGFRVSYLKEKDNGEHSFYWKVVKEHPDFQNNPLFRRNSERDKTSDCSHRNFASYTDHIGNFVRLGFPGNEGLSLSIQKISRIRRFAVTEVYRDDYPDLDNVQILAYQRIVTFRDYLDRSVSSNRFWQAHREPVWCRDLKMDFQLEDADIGSLMERDT